MNYKNIHPIVPEVWNKLHFLSAASIDDFIEKYSINNRQSLIPVSKKNILKSVIKKIIRRE